MPNHSKRHPRFYLAHLLRATTLGIVELSNQAAFQKAPCVEDAIA